jgi:beta-phosphoglucomutase-like phosphatase (HAD superfamily)
MTIGVVTGSGQRPLLNRLLNDFGEFLDENHIVTAYDVKRGKPYPDPYLMGMQKVGDIQPWETIVVENAPLGVRAATAARCFTIAVNTGPLPDHSLTDVGADLLLPSLYRLCRQWDYFFQYAL